MSDSSEQLKVLGFGRPLDHFPATSDGHIVPVYTPLYFPMLTNLIRNPGGAWKNFTHHIREACMLKVVEEFTNKSEWWRKARDEEIAAKWKEEMLVMDWAQYRRYGDFTPEMAETCLRELREKADLYEKTGLVPVLDTGAAVLKADNLITPELKESLIRGVKPLEDVPDDEKDWHPGSDGKVLNLVHPSLWPLVYRRSRILPSKRIGLDDCLAQSGLGKVIPAPTIQHKPRWGPPVISRKFQWLPCELELHKGKASIVSYINNLHPVHHRDLYPVIARFIEKALPAWDVLYRWPESFEMQRLKINKVAFDCSVPDICLGYCSAHHRPLEDGEPERPELGESKEQKAKDIRWFYETHPVIRPDPSPKNVPPLRLHASDVKTSHFFNEASRIQVIVKLANIHLTPDKPSYNGGAWEIEGQVNERICATALYYYDSENISDCHLDFRHAANREKLPRNLKFKQGYRNSITRIFDIDLEGQSVQGTGSVLTRPGRALFFPNLLQYHVSPFELADKTKAGHRKILALFLVDPRIPIISTANVPPQRLDWWFETTQFGKGKGYQSLPGELKNIVMDSMDFPIGWEDARALREELMQEREGGAKHQVEAADWYGFY